MLSPQNRLLFILYIFRITLHGTFKAFFSRIINLSLTKLARDRTGRISAFGLFCTDLAALGPYCQDLGPIFSQYGPRAWLIRYMYPICMYSLLLNLTLDLAHAVIIIYGTFGQSYFVKSGVFGPLILKLQLSSFFYYLLLAKCFSSPDSHTNGSWVY